VGRCLAHGLQHACNAECGELTGENGLGPAGLYEALCSEVVHLVRLGLLERIHERRLVQEVGGNDLQVVEKVAYALEGVSGASPHDADHAVTLLEKEFCQVGAVLTGDPGDERGALCHELGFRGYWCKTGDTRAGWNPVTCPPSRRPVPRERWSDDRGLTARCANYLAACKAARADLHLDHLAAFSDAGNLQVRAPYTAGLVIGMRNVVAEGNSLVAHVAAIASNGHDSALHELNARHLGTVTLAVAGLENARVAAGTGRVAGTDVLEQLVCHGALLHVAVGKA